MLILFDIDLTLVNTSGVGIRSLVAGGRRVFGDAFTAEGIDFGGQLDPVIIAAMLQRIGVEPTIDALLQVRQAYAEELTRTIAEPGTGQALPGVLALLDALEACDPAPTLGVLTGNFEETGRLKLTACAIDPDRFHVHVWGDDSPHRPPMRDHLPPVGVQRYPALRDADLPAHHVTIVGDTVHDVPAGKAHGHRVLGVATGRVDADTLASAGADLVLEDLRDTRGVLAWLTNPD